MLTPAAPLDASAGDACNRPLPMELPLTDRRAFLTLLAATAAGTLVRTGTAADSRRDAEDQARHG